MSFLLRVNLVPLFLILFCPLTLLYDRAIQRAIMMFSKFFSFGQPQKSFARNFLLKNILCFVWNKYFYKKIPPSLLTWRGRGYGNRGRVNCWGGVWSMFNLDDFKIFARARTWRAWNNWNDDVSCSSS